MNQKNSKMNSRLFSVFQDLLLKDRVDGKYQVSSILEGRQHLLGCSIEGFPIFFIKTADATHTSDIKLDLFDVMFDRICEITSDGTHDVTDKFSIIQLNSLSSDLQKYFLDVVEIVLQELPVLPSVLELKTEIAKVIRLFTASPKFSIDVVRGLWAELMVIEQSSDPDYLINSWHVDITDKYDFNDGMDKIEVKSTSLSERKHTFSIEQLNPEDGSDLVVASMFVIRTGIGKSIFDLMDSISGRINNSSLHLKMKEIVLATIGPHVGEAESMFFDYSKAQSGYLLYDYRDIPRIVLPVPSGVSKVSFQADLSSASPRDKSDFSEKHPLHFSL